MEKIQIPQEFRRHSFYTLYKALKTPKYHLYIASDKSYYRLAKEYKAQTYRGSNWDYLWD